jgi:hypothetical protein
LPAADAASLMEIAVGVSPASIALGKKIREMDRRADQGSPAIAARVPYSKATTEHADLAAAGDREQALELELRAPDGSLIATEWIALQDTEFLLSLDDDDFPDTDEFDEWLERESSDSATGMSVFDEDDLLNECERWSEEFDLDWDDEPEKPFPRYQIFVALVNDDAVP